MIEGKQAYATSDLLSRHPEIPSLWRVSACPFREAYLR
jgi:hypothetical protein